MGERPHKERWGGPGNEKGVAIRGQTIQQVGVGEKISKKKKKERTQFLPFDGEHWSHRNLGKNVERRGINPWGGENGMWGTESTRQTSCHESVLKNAPSSTG